MMFTPAHATPAPVDAATALAARLQAVEIVFEEAIAALAETHPAPAHLARRIADRSHDALHRLGPGMVSGMATGDDGAFTLALQGQVGRIARMLAVRLLAMASGRGK